MSSPAIEPAARGGALTRALPAIVLFGLVSAAAVLAFRDTVAGMMRVWNTSNFEHSYLIPLLSLWLLWQQRARLSAVPIAPSWSALPFVAGAALAWLLGRLAGVSALEHLSLIGMIPPLVALLFGWRMLRAAAFPVGFLFFAVPVGEFLQPTLMDWTADFTVAAIQATGIPIVRDGLYFELPSGRWSVVEACSGLRYMLAAIPLACIFAYLSFDSMRKRLLFVALGIAVALVGNWLRAYLIVMIGHFSDMQLAVGVDHLIYGWLFFGVLMGITFWLGSRWADPLSAAPAQAPRGDLTAAPRGATATAALAAALVLGATPPLSTVLLDRGQASVDPAAAARGYVPAERPFGFAPGYEGALRRFVGRSGNDGQVGLAVHQYVRQHASAEMISHGNRLLPHEPGWRIARREAIAPGTLPGASPGWRVNEYEVVAPAGGTRLLVWEWFWINGRPLADPRLVKLHTAADLLRGRGDESLAWFLWTPADAGARGRLAAALGGLSAQGPR